MENKGNIPQCVGIIIDGNRRWARSKNLSTYEGHRIGFEKLKIFFSWAKKRKIKNAIIYILSTENLKRSPDEVAHLFKLFRTTLKKQIEDIIQKDTRVLFIGDRKRFPKDLQKMMDELEEKTVENKPYNLIIAAAYGGRAEIVYAAKALADSGDEATEENFEKYLWTAGIPSPDIIIRSGGEKRLSNFLLWQAAYTELFFNDTYWPDFSEKILNNILEEYKERERRHGR